jgi:hypothetical protein
MTFKKSNSSNETPNVMTVGVENYGLNGRSRTAHGAHAPKKSAAISSFFVNIAFCVFTVFPVVYAVLTFR